MLVLSKLSYRRGESALLQDISYTFNKGSITCITGPSGIGKSTLLSCMANLIASYTGTCRVNGISLKDIDSPTRSTLIGLVFQEGNLFPQLSALANCTQPLQIVQSLTQEQAEVRAQALFKKLHIEECAQSYPKNLSGGQQHRVALARALALKPQVLCLDEPTAALDVQSTREVAFLLKEHSQAGMTLIITSHDNDFVQLVADTVLELKNGSLRGKFLKKYIR